MNVKQKYDILIGQIEERASERYETAMETAGEISRICGMELRDLNALVQYLLGMTLKNYIQERKMNAAYKNLIENKNFDARTAIEISGYDNHSSFCKRFSEVFQMSPTEAFKKKDKSLITPPKTWDVISVDSDCSVMEEAEEENVVNTRYGIPVELYDKVAEIQTLRAMYQLPALYEALAEELWEKEKLTPEEAFRYADGIRDYCGNDPIDECDREDPQAILDPMEKIRRVAYNPYNRFIFFDCDLSLDAGFILWHETVLTEKELMEEPPEILHHYVHWTTADHIHYGIFKDAFEYYEKEADEEYSDEDFHRYMHEICCGLPKEDAFDLVIPESIYDNCTLYTPCEREIEMDIDIMEEEEWDGSDIDSDLLYDPDNPYYDD